METETLHQGRLAGTNPMDDTHKTFKHLKKAGITEAQAEVFTETFKGLADQTMQVNENLLLVRDELRGEITGIHGELKDIHHKIDSNFQKLDAKIDGNFQKLDAKIDGNFQKLDAKIDGNFQKLDAKIDGNFQKLDAKIDGNFQKLDAKIDFSHTTLLGYMGKSDVQAQARQAQTQVSYMRWNIGMFIGTVTMFIGLAGLIIALD